MVGVDFLDVSNATEHSIGWFFLEGYSREVAVFDSYTYAVDSPNGFYVFNLSKPGAQDAIASIQTPQSGYGRIVSIAASRPSLPGPRIVAITGGRTLQVFDVSNPRAPFFASSQKTTGGGGRLFISDKLLYLADGVGGLQLFDLSTASSPRRVGGFRTRARR